ncbi:MAG: 50S ribosomal protein L17 [Candidatus Omnitrophica bacterium]|nr:50S ribosomal protein L17 [Candidatus Omnitrophota bacterium]
MRHATLDIRLSRPSGQRKALISITAKNLLHRGRIQTTVAKAKQTQRAVDRLITLGKEGSVHARRQAYRLLRDRGAVKALFAEIAPRFLDCQGGYTRVLKLAVPRAGDGADLALLELTRLPVALPPQSGKAKAQAQPAKPQEPAGKEAKPTEGEEAPKPKRFLEGLRELFRTKKPGVSRERPAPI